MSLTVFEGAKAILNPLQGDDRAEIESLLNRYQKISGVSILSGSLKVLKGMVESITAIAYGAFSKIAFYASGQEKFRLHSQVCLGETFHGIRQIIQGFADFGCKDLGLTIDKVSFGYVTDEWAGNVDARLDLLEEDEYEIVEDLSTEES